MQMYMSIESSSTCPQYIISTNSFCNYAPCPRRTFCAGCYQAYRSLGAWCHPIASCSSFVFQVCLLVVDSITFHFRQDVTDLAARARQLTRTAQAFMDLAEKHNIAVSVDKMFSWFNDACVVCALELCLKRARERERKKWMDLPFCTLQVVFTNQVTTRILENEQVKLVPALGKVCIRMLQAT